MPIGKRRPGPCCSLLGGLKQLAHFNHRNLLRPGLTLPPLAHFAAAGKMPLAVYYVAWKLARCRSRTTS